MIRISYLSPSIKCFPGFTYTSKSNSLQNAHRHGLNQTISFQLSIKYRKWRIVHYWQRRAWPEKEIVKVVRPSQLPLLDPYIFSRNVFRQPLVSLALHGGNILEQIDLISVESECVENHSSLDFERHRRTRKKVFLVLGNRNTRTKGDRQDLGLGTPVTTDLLIYVSQSWSYTSRSQWIEHP